MSAKLFLGSTQLASESSGTITVDNATLGSDVITPAAGITGTLGSGVTFPAGHVLYTQESNITSTDSNAQATDYTATGNSITVASANVALGSKIIIMFNNHIWVSASGVEARVALRVQRIVSTGVSASTIFESLYMGNHLTGISTGFLWSGTTIDESLGSGDHIYQIQYKKHTSGDVWFLGFSPSNNNIVIQVIK